MHRLNSTSTDARRSPSGSVVEFELLQSGIWNWVWPGPQGQRLTIDELNRVRAYRIDHPDALPSAPVERLEPTLARCSIPTTTAAVSLPPP